MGVVSGAKGSAAATTGPIDDELDLPAALVVEWTGPLPGASTGGGTGGAGGVSPWPAPLDGLAGGGSSSVSLASSGRLPECPRRPLGSSGKISIAVRRILAVGGALAGGRTLAVGWAALTGTRVTAPQAGQ